MVGINLKLPRANFGEHTAGEKAKVFVSLCKCLQGREKLEQLFRDQKNLRLRGTVNRSFKEKLTRIDGTFYLLAPPLYRSVAFRRRFFSSSCNAFNYSRCVMAKPMKLHSLIPSKEATAFFFFFFFSI